MLNLYSWNLRFMRMMSINNPRAQSAIDAVRNDLEYAIAKDDRKTVVEVFRNWPEIALLEEGSVTSFWPPARMALASSRQTLEQVISVCPDF